MNIDTTKTFDKHYKKRIKTNSKLHLKAKQRISLFTKNPNHYLLKNHQLTGTKKHYHAFSITGDIRVVYQLLNKNTALLTDIGSHNQVY